MQGPLQALSQHTPSTQLLLAHSAAAAHALPSPLLGTSQSPPSSHSAVALQDCPALRGVNPHSSSGAPQLPLRQRFVVTLGG